MKAIIIVFAAVFVLAVAIWPAWAKPPNEPLTWEQITDESEQYAKIGNDLDSLRLAIRAINANKPLEPGQADFLLAMARKHNRPEKDVQRLDSLLRTRAGGPLTETEEAFLWQELILMSEHGANFMKAYQGHLVEFLAALKIGGGNDNLRAKTQGQLKKVKNLRRLWENFDKAFLRQPRVARLLKLL